MASIFSLNKQVASLPKHGFPMSEIFDFTASSGQILPIYMDRLNPGEKFRYSVDLFTRTNPLSSPANVEIDEYVDLFFVPLKKLSAVADNILFQIDDVPSTFFKDAFTIQPSGYMFPLFDLGVLGCGDDNTASTYLPAFSTLPNYGSVSWYFDTYIKGAMRLCDHLGVDPTFLIDNDPSTSLRYYPKISPEFFGVYQAIYYDYFRLSNWESNQIAAYNFDNAYDSMDLLTAGKSWSAGPSSGTLKYLLQLHYRPRNKDYFTNVFPSPLVSVESMMSSGIVNLTAVNQWLVNGSYSPIQPSGVSAGNNTVTTVSSTTPASYSQSRTYVNYSTANLRTLFAVDKLLKITGRAGKHYDDQVLAHFGFKVPKGFSDEVVHLGSHHQTIRIGEVISTASTSQGNLGELAGKGYSRGQNQLVSSFTAPCHGFIMAVYSSAPKVSYVGGYNRLHTDVLRYNWFIPELDNLGMSPIFGYENSAEYGQVYGTSRYAWSLRYAHMKCKYNRATHAFITRCPSLGQISNDGPFADWVITDAFQHNYAGNSVELGKLLVSPMDLNQVMLSGYVVDLAYPSFHYGNDFKPEVLYTSDPLIVHAIQTVSKVSGMSIYGLDDKAI